MAVTQSIAVKNTQLAAIRTAVDAGASGKLKLYSGTRPANGGATTTLLASLTMSSTSFQTPSNAVMTANSITSESSAPATGTATWFRMESSTGTQVLDGDVGTTGSDLNMNSTSISIGQTVAVSSFVINASN